MPLSPADLTRLRTLRRQLHARPELSGQEVETAATMADLFRQLGATEVHTGLGGHGVAALFTGNETGPATLLRAELDALPIQELNDFSHASLTPGQAHKCGHDGHLAVPSEHVDEILVWHRFAHRPSFEPVRA